MKKSAYDYASILLKPEYRDKVDAKYKRKIEGIVRRPILEEEEEKTSPCPICAGPVQESLLECQHCHNRLPFCIATVLL